MKRLALLLLCVLPATFARAQGIPVPSGVTAADTLREEDAIRRAIAASPAARAARARLEAARAARSLGRTPLVEAPEAEVSTTLPLTLLPDPDDSATEATVAVTLERPSVRRARRAVADATFDAAAAEARATLDALVFEVRTDYAALAAEETLAALAATLHADADTLVESVALRFRFGDASELDLRLARLDAVRAAAEADEAAGQAAETRARLAARLGTSADALPPLGSPVAAVPDTALTDPLSLPVSPAVPPALAAAEAATRAAEASARYAAAQTRVPTFTVRGGLEYRRLFFGPDDLDAAPHFREDFRRLGRSDFGVLVGVAFPLPFGSPARREAVLAAAEAGARVAEQAVVAADFAVEAEAARLRLRRAEARQARYRTAGADVTESLSLLQLAYAGGEIGLEDLIAGRARLYDTLAASLRAASEASQARLALSRATGTVSTGFRLDP